MSDHTPSDAEVIANYSERGGGAPGEIRRWLAEHDAKVRAEALRKAADKFEQNPDGEWGVWQEYEGWSMDPTEPLREEADRIEREAGLK